ncbi:MAG TPA: SafA/ExsA family spore coat assembly protein [Firmicutes bacterium]|jgi:spore coat assembly protein SafA|nr:SafA/ExsA family spore coat assembly protein [Candidatus Fermentithermobacillaceae bacterium]
MADQEVVQATTYIWMRNRELSPLYERLLVLGVSSECLDLIRDLVDLHRKQRDDCHELLACVGCQIPGEFSEIRFSDDLNDILPILWSRENEAMEMGWMRADRLIRDEGGRTVIIRGTGRQDRKMRLLREIARKCKITLVLEPRHPHRPDDHRPMPPDDKERPPVAGTIEYVVQPGDTMFLIAKRYGVSLDALIKANPQIRNPEMIFPGEVIHIPTGHRPHMAPPQLTPVSPGTGGSGAARRYVVMEGETIEDVARKFGMNVGELTAFNPQLSPPYTLTSGQVIFIPAPGAVG